jgi:hypothetical protein
MQSGVVSFYDLTCIASQLEFGCSLRIQEKTRALFSHLMPRVDLMCPTIPCHVVGGYSSWSDAIHAILHFFRLDQAAQLAEIKKSSCFNRNKFYKKNLKLLIANRPSPCPVTTSQSTTQLASSAELKSELLITRSISRSVTAVHAAARLGAFGSRSKFACSERVSGLTACVVCGFVPTVPILLTKEATKIATVDLGHQCIQCHQLKQQQLKKINKSSQLSDMMALQMNSPSPCSLSQHTTVVDLAGLARSALGAKFSQAVFASRKKKFTVRCVIVTTHVVGKRSFLKQYGEVQAGRLHHESMHCHPNTFSLDKDGLGSDALLLLMPQRSTTGTAHDFAMVMKSNHSTSTVSNFVKKEMNAIRARVTSSRSGPASGVFDPLSGDKCRSFTQVTKKPTTLYVSPPTRTGGMVALYYNHSQRLKRCNHGYRDLAMNRLSRGMKKREAEACKHYKQILTTEGYNFLFSQLCLKRTLLRASNFPELRSIIASHPGDTPDEWMLRWMLLTGEMRNHEAVGCHMDGNKSHGDEILGLFHRSNAQRTNGFMFLPLDNLCIEMCCDTEMLVCSLKDTPHVPDHTQNSNNWSKVHGPPI